MCKNLNKVGGKVVQIVNLYRRGKQRYNSESLQPSLEHRGGFVKTDEIINEAKYCMYKFFSYFFMYCIPCMFACLGKSLHHHCATIVSNL